MLHLTSALSRTPREEGNVLGLYMDNSKENGNYYTVLGLGLYMDNGKENGNYYAVVGYIGVIAGEGIRTVMPD